MANTEMQLGDQLTMDKHYVGQMLIGKMVLDQKIMDEKPLCDRHLVVTVFKHTWNLPFFI
jgi:hypothetical protein